MSHCGTAKIDEHVNQSACMFGIENEAIDHPSMKRSLECALRELRNYLEQHDCTTKQQARHLRRFRVLALEGWADSRMYIICEKGDRGGLAYPVKIIFGTKVSINFIDFPNLRTSGATIAEAYLNACHRIDYRVHKLLMAGLPLPRPSIGVGGIFIKVTTSLLDDVEAIDKLNALKQELQQQLLHAAEE